MKRIIAVVAITMMACSVSEAQNVLRNLGERAKSAVENKIGEKVESAVSGKMEKVLNGKKDKGAARESGSRQQEETYSASQANEAAEASSAGWTCPDCGKAGNQGAFCDDCGARRPAAAATAAEPASPQTGTQKSDFVRGAQQFFFDDVKNEKVGEVRPYSEWETSVPRRSTIRSRWTMPGRQMTHSR